MIDLVLVLLVVLLFILLELRFPMDTFDDRKWEWLVETGYFRFLR